MAKELIISRHEATINLLKKRFPNAELKDDVDESDLEGKICIGNLPIHLASKCKQFIAVSLKVPRDFRGKEFTEQNLKDFNFKLEEFEIKKIKNIEL